MKPGATALTRISGASERASVRVRLLSAAFEKRAPLGKVCDPDDVADAIVSLVTGSDLVTGQILACDGGVLIE
jgi:NAD(P)-dependent dehydrogenase (short-subunit alcohol dehydrogenase family)